MSKSYGKYKTLGYCTGSNTDFYRERRKHERQVNNQRIRNILAHYENDEFDDTYNEYKIPKENQWDEPTDGHYKMTAKELNKQKKEYLKSFRNIYTTKNNRIKK
jgi:hypothetical protein